MTNSDDRARIDEVADSVMRRIIDMMGESFHYKKCVIRTALREERVKALREAKEIATDMFFNVGESKDYRTALAIQTLIDKEKP